MEQSPQEYLSVKELSERIPYSEKTIRNLMVAGIFVRGEHYLKPRGRVIFLWSKVQEWLSKQDETYIPMARENLRSGN
jgi:hypothetical protein